MYKKMKYSKKKISEPEVLKNAKNIKVKKVKKLKKIKY